MKKIFLVVTLVSLTLGACASVERDTASEHKQKGYRPTATDLRK